MIRPACIEDSSRICGIYNHYVESTVITFEEEPVATAEMRNRIQSGSETLPWMVCEVEGQIIGYAYASQWKSRCAYRYSVESSIYLSSDSVGAGIGTQLYGALLEELRQLGFHSVIGGVALPNPASVALFEKFGFEKVAHFREVGRKFDRWIDVGYWQLILQDVEPDGASDVF